MLVLSRKLGEKIVIGDNIIVTVVKIDRKQIRLGIEAPHEVPVYREEILSPGERPVSHAGHRHSAVGVPPPGRP
jgi:carbon storage regulator